MLAELLSKRAGGHEPFANSGDSIGIILLGGAAWTGVRTYKGRGTSSYLIMVFAMFLAALGLFFLFGAFGAVLRGLRLAAVGFNSSDYCGETHRQRTRADRIREE